MTAPELTPRQAAVLQWIRANTLPASPTSREIAKAFGWASPNAATVHLVALERKGLIRRTPGKARNIEVLT